MSLPGFHDAVIDPPKLRDYLLSGSHPTGRFKAAFFASLGYEPAECARLEADLRSLAAAGEVVELDSNDYGRKFQIRGILNGPSGREAEVTTIWVLLSGEETPRFVTAYPDQP